jgi:V8-like Glu-specific endopeptidase
MTDLATTRARQDAVLAYWTPARMAAATPEPNPGAVTTPDGGVRPAGWGGPYSGINSVGAIFYRYGNQSHYCTASAVKSENQELVLTAAHCVYHDGYKPSGSIVYVPRYHSGLRPFGVWVVSRMVVDADFRAGDTRMDFAFLTVTRPPGQTRPLQSVTGANTVGWDMGYNHTIEVVGYPNTADRPVHCYTRSYENPHGYMRFDCGNFPNGTSGGPWLTNYDGTTGTGTVIGVIGGYQQGGDTPQTSYSSYFGYWLRVLYQQAEKSPGTRPRNAAP